MQYKKIVIVCFLIFIFIIGFFLGFAFGFKKAVEIGIEEGIKILRMKGWDIDITAKEILYGIKQYHNHFITCYSEYLNFTNKLKIT